MVVDGAGAVVGDEPAAVGGPATVVVEVLLVPEAGEITTGELVEVGLEAGAAKARAPSTQPTTTTAEAAAASSRTPRFPTPAILRIRGHNRPHRHASATIP